ncbi:MAG: polysaccharide biosynthesis C-terminal domain-containing protein [Eubacterium sp.]
MYNGVSGILRALGDSKTPLIFLIVASITNVVLDLIFVLVFGWGVVGAAVATAFSQFLSAISCIIYAYKTNTYFKLKKSDFRPRMKIVKKTLRLGIPVALQNSLIAISLSFTGNSKQLWSRFYYCIYCCIENRDTCAAALMSIGAAVSTFTGQNWSRKYQKSYQRFQFSQCY